MSSAAGLAALPERRPLGQRARVSFKELQPSNAEHRAAGLTARQRTGGLTDAMSSAALGVRTGGAAVTGALTGALAGAASGVQLAATTTSTGLQVVGQSAGEALGLAHRRPTDAEAAELAARAMQQAFVLDDELLTVDGNLYRYFAFRKFGVKSRDGLALFDPPRGFPNGWLHTWGLLMVMVIQILGPLSIWVASVGTVEVSFTAWKDYTISQWATVILSWCFLFCFILNAYYCVQADEQTSKLCDDIARALIYVGEPVSTWWLWADAFVNCFVAVACSWDMYSLMLGEEDPKSVMMDALGLAFLLRIDDIAGEMSFMGGIWDPLKVGRLYEQLRTARVFERARGRQKGGPNAGEAEGGSSEEDSDVSDSDRSDTVAQALSEDSVADSHGRTPSDGARRGADAAFKAFAGNLRHGVKKRVPRQVPQLVYVVAKACLIFQLTVAIPLPFLFKAKAKTDERMEKAWDSISGHRPFKDANSENATGANGTVENATSLNASTTPSPGLGSVTLLGNEI